MKKRGLFLRLFVSVVASVLVLWFVDWKGFTDTLKAANAYWLFGVFVIIHLDRSFMAYKWMVLAKGGGLSVSAGTSIKSYYVGSFWGGFLPASVGGDVVRAGWLSKKTQGGPLIISSIVIERLLGAVAQAIVALLSIFLLGVYLDVRIHAMSGIFFVVVFVAIVALTTIFNESGYHVVEKFVGRLGFHRIDGVIGRMRSATLGFKDNPRVLGVFLSLSILEQVFPIMSAFILAKAFSIELPLVWAVMGVPIILAVSRMPISVNTFGIKEGAYAFIFSLAGIPMAQSVMLALADRVLLLLATLPGALWTVGASKHNEGPVPVARLSA